MLTQEEFAKAVEKMDAEIAANMGEFIMSKVGESADEDTRRVFPIALFNHASQLLFDSLIPDGPEWLKTDFLKVLAKETRKFVTVWQTVEEVTAGRVKK